MTHWGKLIGGLIGLATGRLVFVVIGVLLGHQFDRGFAVRYAGLDGAGGPTSLPEGFARILFQVMGHLAKIDGRVTEDEIRAARGLMHRMNMGPGQIRSAIAWFTDGKQPDFTLEDALGELRRQHAKRPEQRALFLRLLMEVSLSKNRLHQAERMRLWTVAQALDVSRVELAQVEAMLRAQRSFRRSPQGDTDSERVADAYKTLGVDKTATNAEIKRAYRRLMSRYHPDKLASSDPSPNEVDAAERLTREIRGAYELLKTRRAIR